MPSWRDRIGTRVSPATRQTMSVGRRGSSNRSTLRRRTTGNIPNSRSRASGAPLALLDRQTIVGDDSLTFAGSSLLFFGYMGFVLAKPAPEFTSCFSQNDSSILFDSLYPQIEATFPSMKTDEFIIRSAHGRCVSRNFSRSSQHGHERYYTFGVITVPVSIGNL